MPDPAGDKHQLAGLDEQARGFNRPVEFLASPSGFQAVLRYEQRRVVSSAAATATEALGLLIASLQTEGYRQLRSQQSFRNGTYLGSQEPWIEYPDPPELQPDGLLAAIKRWFG
ncbi:MAG: hypothetical protein KF814_13025 [Nitrospiraceae bacterium]|nr:hypothetical protein [Nitrospiraceae bacterium]